jgi:hypothetical protein
MLQHINGQRAGSMFNSCIARLAKDLPVDSLTTETGWPQRQVLISREGGNSERISYTSKWVRFSLKVLLLSQWQSV